MNMFKLKKQPNGLIGPVIISATYPRDFVGYDQVESDIIR